MAITGKPLAATAGAMMFQKGGNAVDAACAMLAATCTMWDTLSWGGETQALIYNPHTKKVIGINALGVAPTGATAEFYKSKGWRTRPSTARSRPSRRARRAAADDARRVRQAVARTCSRRRSRWPTAIPSRRSSPTSIERKQKASSSSGRTRAKVMLPHAGAAREAPRAGRDLPQPDLAATLRKLVEAEQQALKRGQETARPPSTPPTTASTKATSRRRSRAARRSRAGSSPRRTSRSGRCDRGAGQDDYKGIDVYKLTSGRRGRRCSRR
jgi:gamma-glutamyltranspeptidase/glutathione hydrolase